MGRIPVLSLPLLLFCFCFSCCHPRRGSAVAFVVVVLAVILTLSAVERGRTPKKIKQPKQLGLFFLQRSNKVPGMNFTST
jgi:hypothetical protein